MNESEALFLLGLALKYLPELAKEIGEAWANADFSTDTAEKLEKILPVESRTAALVTRWQSVP